MLGRGAVADFAVAQVDNVTSISLAVTEPADTAAFDLFAVAIAYADLAVVEGPDVVDVTIAVIMNMDMAVTETVDTTNIITDLIMNMDLAVTETAVDTVSMAGQVIMNLDMAVVEARDVAAFDVWIVSYIDFVATEGNDAFAAAGWLNAMASLAVTEQPDTASFKSYTGFFFTADGEVAYVPWETRQATLRAEKREFRMPAVIAATKNAEAREAKVRSRRRPIQ